MMVILLVLLTLLHNASSFVPQFSRRVTKPLYSKSIGDENDGKLTNQQIANGIFVDRSSFSNDANNNNVRQRPTFSVEEKVDENGTSQRPTFSIHEKQNENESDFPAMSGNHSVESNLTPSNGTAPNIMNEEAASVQRSKTEAFPVFSAFFASPETTPAAKSSSFTSLGASPMGVTMEKS